MKAQINPTRARRFQLNLAAILLLIILFNGFKTHGQKVKNFAANQPFLFEENKGQLMDESGNTLSDIKYYGKQGDVYVYCKPGMLSFVFTKIEKQANDVSEATGMETGSPFGKHVPTYSGGAGGFKRSSHAALHASVSTSRMDLVLLGSNPTPLISATDQQEYYENFYISGDANREITNVHTYKKVIYKNIYPNIDMLLNIANKGMEYSFLVHPGGKVNNIKLRWDGAEKEEALKNGGIKYANISGSMEESAPKSFVDGKTIQSRFFKDGTQFSFRVENYDKKKDLLIDPTLEWATYYGGSNIDGSNCVSVDKLGNIAICGTTVSTSGIATTGSFQSTYLYYSGGSAYDAFIATFSNDGKRRWATYYGSYFSTYGLMGLAFDGSGNVYLGGSTDQQSNIATSGAYQTTTNYQDAYLVKFDTSGYRLWGTYFGGNYITNLTGVATDSSNNVYITGLTRSTTNIATNGAYQTSMAGGTSYGDAFLAKFSSSGSIIWSTYFGGSSDDLPFSVSVDRLQNIYITGQTSSTNGIATSGAYRTYYNGGNQCDGFLTKFNTNGGLTWSTYFGGLGSEGAGFKTAIDRIGNIYLTGIATNSGLATSGAFKTNFSGNGEGFLAKFNTSGYPKWVTYYDGGIEGVVVDDTGNIFITGGTQSTTGMTTKYAYQSTPTNLYLAQFDSSGSRLWGTYYGWVGTPNYDEVFGIACDKWNHIYITGFTTNSSGISTKYSYQPSYGGGEDAFLARFKLWAHNDAGIDSIQIPNVNCADSYQVKVVLKNYGLNPLKKVNIRLDINSDSSKTYPWTGNLQMDSSAFVNMGYFNFKPGKDSVRVWTSMPNGVIDSIPQNDSAMVIATVNSLPNAYTRGNLTICQGPDSIPIGTTSITGHTYLWTSKPSGFTSNIDDPFVKPTKTTTYYLTETITATGCSATDSSVISVNPIPTANAGKSRSICYGYVDTLGSSDVPGDTYAWFEYNKGNISSLSNPIVKPTKTTRYYLFVTNTYSCADSDSVTITVNPLPTANAGKDTLICAGDSVQLGAESITGDSYSWSVGPDSEYSSTLSNPVVYPLKPTTYYLSVTNVNTGCKGKATVSVKVNPIPYADIYTTDSVFCLSDSLTVYDSDTQSVSHKWYFGDGVSDTGKYPAKHHYKSGGVYHIWLKVTNTTGCSDSSEKTIYVDGSCVWPGDANYDKVDNIYDLLAIGIAYNDTGSKRTDTTTQWYAHPCVDWTKSFKSGANHKHADCNGDGKVDSLDMAAIVRNYSKSHSKSGGSITSGNPNDPELSLSISKDSVGTSDTISIEMNLGTASKSLSNIYGIALTVTYDPVNTGRAKSFSADFSNCWMGTVGKNLVYLIHNDSINGVMDIGITRTDHKNISGYGEIGKLTIIMPDNVGGKRLIRKELRFGLENIKAIDNVEDDISLYTVGDSVLFYGYSSGIAPLTNTDNNIRLYPNPAQSTLHLDAGKELISEIGISDMLGRNVMTLKYNQVGQTDMNIGRLIPGTYFIYILTDHGFARSRFVKE